MRILELSNGEALRRGHNFVNAEHILLGIVLESEGVAAKILTGLGSDLTNARQRVHQFFNGTLE